MNELPHQLQDVDPMLLPPREVPYVLQDVYEKFVFRCRDELVLHLGDCYLRFRVEPDTDSITVQFVNRKFKPTKRHVSARGSYPWKSHLNKECGWTWLAINQQGYMDTVLLSFTDIEPVVLMQAIGSSIELYLITPAKSAIETLKARKRHGSKIKRRVAS